MGGSLSKLIQEYYITDENQKFEFKVYTCTYNFRKSADLEFPVSGRSKQASKHRYTHACVWGSLRLAPNISMAKFWAVRTIYNFTNYGTSAKHKPNFV